MTKKIALAIIAAVILTIAAVAHAQDPAAGYEWSSPLGSLRKSANNENVYIFDTTSGNYLTDHKQSIVPYNTKKDNNLTDLGKTLKGKLLKIDGVADVAIEYRRLWIQKFPLDDWAIIMPELQKALK